MALISEVPKDTDLVRLSPKGGFVIKTRLQAPSEALQYPVLTKTFVNVCSDSHVPLPEVANEEFVPEIVYPMIVNNTWEIPIVVSKERVDKDKKGQMSLVFDCFINDRCMSWVQLHKELRQIVVEWCLESIETRFQVSLDRDAVKFPKLSYKGEFTVLEVRKCDLHLGVFSQKKEIDRIQKEEDHLLVLDAIEDAKNQSSDVDIFGRNVASKSLIEEVDTKETTTLTHVKPLQPLSRVEKQQQVSAVNKDETLTFELQFVTLPKPSAGYKYCIELVPRSSTKKPISTTFELVYSKESESLKVKAEGYKVSDSFEVPLPKFMVADRDIKICSFWREADQKIDIFL